jgi:hypothetical protein
VSTSKKVCGICSSGYQDWSTHVLSLKHRRKAHRAAYPLGSRKSPKRLAKAWGARAARRDYEGEDHVKVRKYRRRPPLDGAVRSVHVGDYWRWNGSRNR